jgi:hypothetical protein
MNNLEIDSKYKKWLNVVCKDGDLHPSINFMCQKHKRLIDKIPVGFRDIFSFKTINDFIFYVDGLESETEREEKIKNDGSKVIYENQDFIVKRVFTMEAMSLYGKGTKWCISSEIGNQWDRYIENGDIFFLVLSKKLTYESQFSKFIVQLTSDKRLFIWDKSDNSYDSNIFDLLSIKSNLFLDDYNLSIIDRLFNLHIDNDVLKILSNNNAIIAGGALTSLILDEKINDFDIWFSNEKDYEKAINDMSNLDYVLKKSFSKYTTINAITFTIENKKYQIINPSKYSFGDVNEIINKFDFTCVMCGVDINKKQMVYDERFFKDIKTKQIVINKALKAPTSLISRIIKYTKKGYRVSIDTERDILRILSKVSEKEIDDAILTMY